MAVNKLHVIHEHLSARMEYIKDPKKTQEGSLVIGFNCTADTAYSDMMETKRHYAKTNGRLGYHLMQSFQPGEISPERALEFGREFGSRYLKDRYEVIVSVHDDKAHVHCHILWNSVSYVDGLKYHAPNGQYLDRIRCMSDDICREWGLSVIERQEQEECTTVGQHYAAWHAEQTGQESWRTIIRRDIDHAIQSSVTWRQFIVAMQQQGYEFKEGKHLAVRSPDQERFIRLQSLGDGYQVEDIRQRILRNRVPNRRPATFVRPVPKKLTGLRALYWKYLYLMGIVRKGQYTKRPSKGLRADIVKMRRITAECRLINRERIETLEHLHIFKAATIEKIESLKGERTQLHIQKNATLPDERFSLVSRIAEINKELSRQRKELRMADSIEKRSLEITERIAEAERPEPESKERKPQRGVSR